MLLSCYLPYPDTLVAESDDADVGDFSRKPIENLTIMPA
jgi:hypothetical protein